MTTQCSLSLLADKQARVTMVHPAGGWTWVGNTLVRTHSNLLTPFNYLTGAFKVDLSGCVASANVFNVIVRFTGNNITTLSQTLPVDIVTSIAPGPGGGGACGVSARSLNTSNTYSEGPNTVLPTFPQSLVSIAVANKATNVNTSTFARYHNLVFMKVPLSVVDVKAPFIAWAIYPKGAYPLDYDGGGDVVPSAGGGGNGWEYQGDMYTYPEYGGMGSLNTLWPYLFYGLFNQHVGSWYQANVLQKYNQTNAHDSNVKFFYYYSSSLTHPTIDTGNFSTGSLPSTLGAGRQVFDYGGINRPTGTGDVWIAAYIQCINSQSNPAPAGSLCYREPYAYLAGFRGIVKDFPTCNVGGTNPDIYITPETETYYTSNTTANDDSGITPNFIASNACSAGFDVQNKISRISSSTGVQYISGPSEYVCGNPNLYEVNIVNSDALSGATLTIDLPLIDGVAPIVTDISPGGSVVGNSIVWNYAYLSGNSTIDPKPSFKLSRATGSYTNNTIVTMTGTLAGDGQCNSLSLTVLKSVSLSCNQLYPELKTFKYLDKQLINYTGSIFYALETINFGAIPSRYSFVIDRVPAGTVFDSAYMSGTIPTMTGLVATGYTCVGCKIFFSNSSTLPIISPSALYSYVTSGAGRSTITVNANATNYLFTAGTCDGLGVCTSPFGTGTKDILVLHDNTNLANHNFVPGTTHTVGIKVNNISNVRGDIITNIAGTFATDLLQAISNQVETTLLPLFIPNSIGGIVYADANMSSGYNTGEGLFSGVLVSLYSGSTVIATGLTNMSGIYYFGNLPDGTYKVIYDEMSSSLNGYLPFVSNTGYVLGSGSRGMIMGITGLGDITLTGGEYSVENNFGLVEKVTCQVNGYIYIDTTMNDLYDSGDTVLSGQLITLSNGSTTTTNSFGYYLITGLDCTLGYTIYYTGEVSNYSHSSAQFEYSGQQLTDTGIVVATGTFSIPTNDIVSLNNNFGLIPTCELNGYVYIDTNMNDIYDGTDSAVTGQTITLSNGLSTITNGAGYYVFSGLDCSLRYDVYYTGIIADHNHSSAQFEYSGQQLTDTGIVVATGTFDANSGDIVSPNNNFGLIPTCELNGYVYIDNNVNDLYDSGDTIVTGQVITLSNGLSTTTNEVGYYVFTGLVCQTGYTVSYTGSVNGYSHSSAQFEYSGQQLTDTGIVVATGTFSIPTNDIVSLNNNFGLIPTCELNGYVYIDTNMNDIYDGTDSAVTGQTITLSNGLSTITNGAGYYVFSGLDCSLRYDVYYTGIIADHNHSSAQFEYSGQQLTDTGIVVATGTFSIPTNDIVSLNNNFGLVPVTCELNGYVYIDLNVNNLYDSGSDLIVTGQLITLSNGLSTITDAMGYYVFTGLKCASGYTVDYTGNVAGYLHSSAQFEYSGQQLTDTGIEVATGTFDIPTNDIISPNNNFGLVPETCFVNGYVYVDMDLNDLYDTGELVLTGASIVLSNGMSTITDAMGYYEFSGVVCSSGYTVTLSGSLPGYEYNSAQFEYNTQQASNTIIEIATGTFDNLIVDLISPNNNFGLVPTQCALDGYVYVDVNGNMSYDTGDYVLTGQLITLSNGSSTITDTMGYYLFTGLDCETMYTVSFTGENTGYYHSSAQFEYSTQQPISTGIDAVTGTFDRFLADTYSPDNNFGVMTIPCDVNGYIYLDMDHDDLFTSGVDAPMTGLIVYLDGTMYNTTTNNDGYYEFTGVSCGLHTVTFDNTTMYVEDSAQMEQTTQQSTPVTITIPAGTMNPLTLDVISPDNNFGLEAYSCEVNGYVYIDTDHDDYFTTGVDQVLVGIMVKLDGVRSVFTNMSGYYYFTGIGCGPHIISYNNLPFYAPDSAQYEQTTQQPDPYTSIVIPNSTFNVLIDDTISPHNNFGVELGSIKDTQGGTYIPVPLPTPSKIIAQLETIISNIKKTKIVQLIDSAVDELFEFVAPDSLPETGVNQ
ncbi:MAG TPA: SdrD B-like domain-containing protein [Candidatus Absconditabacterales bacterium]|nr:SdrD B-like domain-containing protein [Candidatus Absconditabacterales bacterium]